MLDGIKSFLSRLVHPQGAEVQSKKGANPLKKLSQFVENILPTHQKDTPETPMTAKASQEEVSPSKSLSIQKLFFHSVLSSAEDLLEGKEYRSLEGMTMVDSIAHFQHDLVVLFEEKETEIIQLREQIVNCSLDQLDTLQKTLEKLLLTTDAIRTLANDLKVTHGIEVQFQKILDETTDSTQKLHKLRELSEWIHHRLDVLKPGQRLIISGGVMGINEASGHAMLYELEKGADDIVKLKIFQSGLGIRHHIKQENKYQTYIVEDMDLVKFKDSGFVLDMLKIRAHMQDRSILDQLKATLWSHEIIEGVKSIYRCVEAKLIKSGLGIVVEFEYDKEEPRFHQEQELGVCARKVFQFVFKERLMDNATYRQAKVSITEHRLEDLKKIPSKEPLQETAKKTDTLAKAAINWLVETWSDFLHFIGLQPRDSLSVQDLRTMGEQVLSKRKRKAEDL